jgi:hypothetical protein
MKNNKTITATIRLDDECKYRITEGQPEAYRPGYIHITMSPNRAQQVYMVLQEEFYHGQWREDEED